MSRSAYGEARRCRRNSNRIYGRRIGIRRFIYDQAEEESKRKAAEAVEQARLDDPHRAQAKKDAEEAEQRRREADTKHKASINNAALAAFIEHGMPEDCAKQAVKLITRGLIPALQINY
ncbi:hypothetical protein [Kerstersia sp.]|uniref:hypothetical protein n=1 Tax=Kerstersia sp. TaxID=1930783 RepID=UPI003F909498